MLKLRQGDPSSSARMLGTPIPRHQAMIELADANAATPLVGITTSEGPRPGLFPLGPTGASTETVRGRTENYLALLNEGERATSTFELDSEQWRTWCNIHRFLMRHGCCLDDLSITARDAALGVLRAALSPVGFAGIRGVMQLNETIQELTGRRDEHGYPQFGEWPYWMSTFGAPSESEPWGFQLDGHHLNLNFLVLGEQIVATPFFLGSEPLVAETGRYVGVAVLQREERDALDLVQSLDAGQRRAAVVADEMPPGLFAGAFSDNVTLDFAGIVHGALRADQQELLWQLIGAYVGRLEEGQARAKLEEVRAHLDETYFAWMGRTEDESVFYYRVHSPVLLLEFDHEPGIVFEGLEPMRSHVHSIMRTPNGNDYGTDLIRQHRALVAHHPAH